MANDDPAIRYDAIVIGAGQAGPPLARRLAAAGMTVAVIERGRRGGPPGKKPGDNNQKQG